MSKKENKETALSVKGQFSLENVPTMLEQVNAKIKALKGDKERAAKITESIAGFGKISDIKDPARLIDAYAFITRKAAAYKEFSGVFQEIDTLNKVKPFTEGGHSLNAWQEEILAQYRETTFEAKLAKLEKAKALLTENLSAEQKFVATMSDMMDVLGD